MKASASAVHTAAVLLFCFFVSAAADHRIDDQSVSPMIQEACRATRYPESCQSSLAKSRLIPPDPNPLQIIGSSLILSSKNLGTARSMVRAILNHSVGNLNRTTVAKTCLEALGNSGHRLRSTAAALPRGRIKDARAWSSAALGYQYDCWSGLKKVNDTKTVVNTMSFMNDTVMVSTSNALSMMMSYDELGNETGSWAPPRTERDGFWERVGGGSGSSRPLGVPKDLKADVTVCGGGGGGGGCIYATVQEAVNGAPENLRGRRRYVIWIKEGVYEEIVRVPLSKKNVVFVGDGMGKTVITGSLNVGQPGLSTYDTATLGVLGDGFMARDLTVQNTAGPDVHQAVAFRSDSDTSVIENCEFVGHQDTLYVHSARQLYKSCVIQGTVDFIFGDSASVFENCTLLLRPRQLNPDAGENNVVSAHSRIDPAQTTGFVFRDSLVNGTDEYTRLYRRNRSAHRGFLGRPWKEFSRTVFVGCDLGEVISPPGWMPWDGEFALKTLYYGEFGNRGPGADLSGRVAWSSQIPADHVDAYSVRNFLQGDEWRL